MAPSRASTTPPRSREGKRPRSRLDRVPPSRKRGYVAAGPADAWAADGHLLPTPRVGTGRFRQLPNRAPHVTNGGLRFPQPPSPERSGGDRERVTTGTVLVSRLL